MKREVQGVVMFLVGGAVLRASLTDVYLRYVKSGLRPLLIMAGALLIVAAIATFWYVLRPARRPDTDRPGSDGVEAGHREPRVAWLLVLPLFALIVVTPPALGSYAADRTGTALQRPPGFADLPAGDPVQLTVVDYAARAVYDHGRSLGDRRVEISGFVGVGGHGEPYLARMVLSCCAADAQPVKVGLSGNVPADLRPDVWLDVIGTYTDKQVKDIVNGGPVPYISVSVARPVRPPTEQYQN